MKPILQTRCGCEPPRPASGWRRPRALVARAAGILLACICTSARAGGGTLSDNELLQIKFDQKLNAQISPDLVFLDDSGKRVELGSCFGKRPVVLILGYYGCPMLCTLVLNGAIAAFQDLKWTVGAQFDVVFVSIDPAETPALAAAKKSNCFHSYGRGAATGWHFLTGDTNSIRRLADEVGFRFAYDPAFKQYAHPSGFVVLTPEGKLSRYFFGVTYSTGELDSALRAAAENRAGSRVEQFVLLCCQYNPLRGRHGRAVMTAVQISGVATAAALAVLVLRQPKNRESKKPK